MRLSTGILVEFVLLALTFSCVSAFWFWGRTGAPAPPGQQYGECQWHTSKTDSRPVALPDGRVLVPESLHAANMILPIGSYAIVRNEKNGKTVTVQITERGPDIVGRVADLSPAAFKEITDDDLGLKVVECTVTPVMPEA